MICERCRKSVPISDMKYVPKEDGGRVGLCNACRARSSAAKSIAAAKKEEKIPYFCTRCRYKFKHDPRGLTNLQCPYCGKADKIMEHKPTSADQLLREDFDYTNFA